MREWNWLSGDGQSKNTIDDVLVNHRWKSSVLSCRLFVADIGSIHKLMLVLMGLGLGATENVPRTKIYDEFIRQCVRKEYKEAIQKNIISSFTRNMNIEKT